MICPYCGCQTPNNPMPTGPAYGYSRGYGWGWGGAGGGAYYGPAYAPPYPMGTLPTDEDIQSMIYDNIDNDPLVPFDVNVNVVVDAGEVRLIGTVPTKRAKHAIGDDAWWVPGVTDVHNEVKIEKKERPAGAAKITARSRM